MLSTQKSSSTCLADIERYFFQPPPQFLDLELAVCWVLACLSQEDNYPTGLLQQLQLEQPQLRLSETVLQHALDFLEQQGSITSYSKRCPSRGRPRRMLRLLPQARTDANRLIEHWQRWLSSHGLTTP